MAQDNASACCIADAGPHQNLHVLHIINRVSQDLLRVLEGQPDTKYLEALNDDDFPQVGGAVPVMVQFKSTLASLKNRHFKPASGRVIIQLPLPWRKYPLGGRGAKRPRP